MAAFIPRSPGEEEFTENFCRNLLSLRKMKGFSQMEVAQTVCRSRSAYSYLENNWCRTDVYTAYQLCGLYEVSPNDMLLSGLTPQPFCRPRRGGCAELLRLLPLLSNEQLRGLIQAAEQLLEPKWP